MERFGEKLRTLRKNRNITMKDLASVLGISAHSYVSKLENNEKNPSVEMVIKVSRFFNVPLDNLLKDELEIDDFLTKRLDG